MQVGAPTVELNDGHRFPELGLGTYGLNGDEGTAAVGAAIVWVPAAAYFFMTGAVGKGLILVAVGAGVIGLVDNLLRPVLVGKDTRMPDYVILVSTVGGISIFGINGFVIGPLIAALFISAWTIFREERHRHPGPLPDRRTSARSR